jgi:hypothetical protein
MTSRKIGLSPVPVTTNSRVKAFVSKEYMEAVQTLNEETMNHACELLLKGYHPNLTTTATTTTAGAGAGAATVTTNPGTNGEHDTVAISNDVSSNSSGKSVPEQLLDMYFKAEESLQVLQTQQPPPSITMMPSLLGGPSSKNPLTMPPGAPSLTGPNMPSGRISMTLSRGSALGPGVAGAHHMSSKLISKQPSLVASGLGVGKQGVIPMRRTAALNTKQGRPLSVVATATSSSSLDSTHGTNASSGHGNNNNPNINHNLQFVPTKKQRLSPTLNDSSSLAMASSAPPPSALSFLAKLNKSSASGDSSTTTTTTTNGETTTSKEPSSPPSPSKNNLNHALEETTAANGASSNEGSSPVPKRKNPPRGFHPMRRSTSSG